MTTTRTGQQPAPLDARPPTVTAPAMEPIEIAWNRLTDYAQGAHSDLFDQASAVRIANRLAYLEEHHASLRRAAETLHAALNVIQLTGPTPDVVQVARALDLTVKELRQP
jgi:hypothetical protein